MKNFVVMIKPASSLCNLQCKYCFYEDVSAVREIKSYGIMSRSVIKKALAEIDGTLSDGDVVNFAFQGGEPSVAGLDWFEFFVNETKKFKTKIKLGFSFQTNGTFIDENWIDFFIKNNVLVGVSYDMLPDVHNYMRCGSAKKVLDGIALLEKNRVEFNILCTLTNSLARHPDKVWKEILKNNFNYVQFTPCMGNLLSSSDYALTPERFSSFYRGIFKLWYTDFQQGKYRSIKLFDDIVNLLARGIPTSCGINGICQPQLVVEADGSVYPCDFYCLDEYKLGNICETTLEELWNKSSNSSQKKAALLPDLCNSCPHLSYCRGNCRRMRENVCFSQADKFCGYREFLDATIERFKKIAAAQ